MTMYSYPAEFCPDGKGFTVTFPDFPEIKLRKDTFIESIIASKEKLEDVIRERLVLGQQLPERTQSRERDYLITARI